VSRDRLTYTFDLKKTYRFHTDAQVTAQSFADALHRVANPRMQSPATLYMRDIFGVEVMGGTARNILELIFVN
jgi:ABC-type oligopeptide transport system substrate-binding subunit